MVGACTEAERELKSCMVNLFTRRPLLQSTPPREDKDQPRILKSSAQIEQAWQRIFERRRLGEPDDRCAINDPDRLAKMWVAWQNDELSYNEQRWLTEYLNGNLRRTLSEAEAKCHRVKAPRFSLSEVE